MGYTAREAALVIGATQRTVVDWGFRGFIKPGVKDSNGRGDRKVYSEENLVQMKIVQELFRRGFNRKEVETLTTDWGSIENYQVDSRFLAEWLIIVDARYFYISSLPLATATVVPGAKYIVAINLMEIKKELYYRGIDAKVDETAPESIHHRRPHGSRQ